MALALLNSLATPASARLISCPALHTGPVGVGARLNEIDREMFGLGIPALGALIAEPLYVLADTAVVGRIGTPQLGGLGLATQIIGTVLGVSIFLAYGTTSAVSRLLGAGRRRDAAHQAVQSLWIAAGVGVFLGAVCWVFATPLLQILQAEPDVVSFGRRYLRISVFGFPAMLIMLAAVGYLRGLKDTTRPLIVAVVTALGNLVLELILVFGLDLGIGASALSTVIFQWVGASAYLWWVLRDTRQFDLSWAPDPQTLRRLGRDGVDLFWRTTALRASFLGAAAFAASIGTEALAGHEVTMAIFYILALALDAVAIAAQAMVGTLLGAGDAPRALIVGRRLAGWGLVLGVGAAAVIGITARRLPHLFTNDVEVIGIAADLLLILALALPVAGLTFALDGILIGAGDLRYLSRAMMVSAASFAVMLVVVAISNGGIVAMWVALSCFIGVRAATLIWRMRGTAWIESGSSQTAIDG